MSINLINITSNNISQLQQKLLLSPGQVLKGQVVEVQGNQVVLQLGGGMLTAQTRVRLKSGQRLNLLVESVDNSIISMKVIPHDKAIKPESLLLMRMGIKPQENMEKVLVEFLRFQLPLNPPDIMEISGFCKDNRVAPEMIPIIVWLRSSGIKVSTGEDLSGLKQLLSFFRGDLPEREEARFFKFLNQLENNIPGGYNISGCAVGENHIYILTSSSGKQRLQPETCQVIMRLKSRILEELWVKMDIMHNNLNIDILCSNEEGCSLLNREMVLFENALKSAGYRVGRLTVEAGRADTVFDFLPDNRPGITGINVKV